MKKQVQIPKLNPRKSRYVERFLKQEIDIEDAHFIAQELDGWMPRPNDDPGGTSPGLSVLEVNGKLLKFTCDEVQQKGLTHIIGEIELFEIPRDNLSTIRIGLENFNLSYVNPSSLRLFKYDENQNEYYSISRSGISVNKEIFYAVVSSPGKYIIAGLPRDRASRSVYKIHQNLQDLVGLYNDDYIFELKSKICELILCGPDQFRENINDPRISKELGYPDDLGNRFSFLDGLEISKNEKGKPFGISRAEFPSGLKFPQRPINNICDRCPNPSIPNANFNYTTEAYKWESRGPTNLAGRTKCIAVKPDNSNVMLAGSAGGGIWKSTNRGRTWRPISLASNNISIGAICFSEKNPSIVVAGLGEYTRGHAIPSTEVGTGILWSEDSGESWKILPQSQGQRGVSKILIDKTDSNVFYVAGDGGIFRWDNPNQAPKVIYNKLVSDITFEPSNSNVLIAAVEDSPGIVKSLNPNSNDQNAVFHGVVWDSFDNGIQWDEIAPGFYSNFTKFSYVGNTFLASTNFKNPNNVWLPFLGIYKYDGNRWNQLTKLNTSTLFSWCNVIKINSQNENIIFAGGKNMYYSLDAGVSWSFVNTGHVDNHDVVFDRFGNQTEVFVANDGGVFKSPDFLGTLNTFVPYSTGMRTIQFYNLSISREGTFAIGGSTQDNGILRSVDKKFFEGIAGPEGGIFKIDPSDSDIIYLEPWNKNLSVYFHSLDKLFEIHRGFENGGSGDVLSLIVRPSNIFHAVCSYSVGSKNQIYYAQLNSIEDLIRDGWTKVFEDSNTEIRSLAFAPSNGSIIYAGNEEGEVFRSNTGGRSFFKLAAINLPAEEISDIKVDPNNEDKVYALLSGFGNYDRVYKSTNGGNHWSPIVGSGINKIPHLKFHSMITHPSLSGVLYIAAAKAIFRTSNDGLIWERFDEGLPNFTITDIDHHKNFKEIYISTLGWGIWSRKLGSKRIWEISEIDFPFQFSGINS